MSSGEPQLFRGLKTNLPSLDEGGMAYTTDETGVYIGTSGGNKRIDANQTSAVGYLDTLSGISDTLLDMPLSAAIAGASVADRDASDHTKLLLKEAGTYHIRWWALLTNYAGQNAGSALVDASGTGYFGFAQNYGDVFSSGEDITVGCDAIYVATSATFVRLQIQTFVSSSADLDTPVPYSGWRVDKIA